MDTYLSVENSAYKDFGKDMSEDSKSIQKLSNFSLNWIFRFGSIRFEFNVVKLKGFYNFFFEQE